MTKSDWLTLFIRILGLYLIGTHFASFVTTTSSLIVLATRPGGLRAVTEIYPYQGPVVSAIVLAVGLVFLFRAPLFTAMIERRDKR